MWFKQDLNDDLQYCLYCEEDQPKQAGIGKDVEF